MECFYKYNTSFPPDQHRTILYTGCNKFLIYVIFPCGVIVYKKPKAELKLIRNWYLCTKMDLHFILVGFVFWFVMFRIRVFIFKICREMGTQVPAAGHDMGEGLNALAARWFGIWMMVMGEEPV